MFTLMIRCVTFKTHDSKCSTSHLEDKDYKCFDIVTRETCCPWASSFKPDIDFTPLLCHETYPGIDDDEDVDRDLLSGIYERIQSQEFRPGVNHVTQVMKVEQTIVGNRKPALALPHRRLVCYCRLYQMHDPNKKEKIGLHQREVFLFNDLLFVTKIFSKKKTGITYAFKQSFSLCDMQVYLFETPHYLFCVRLVNDLDNTVLITFNSRNDHDRQKFVEDLKEAILECNGMEQMRIDEQQRYNQNHNPLDRHYANDDTRINTYDCMKTSDPNSNRFVTVKLHEAARQTGTQIGFQQLSHDGTEQDDWMIDNLRVGGKQVNPEMMVSNFTENVDPGDWSTFDNIHTDEYCGKSYVAIGDAPVDESATLTTQDLHVKSGHMLQFWYNVGCMRPWNTTVAPVHLQYSTDYGMTWEYVTPQCLTNNPDCPQGASMASVYYGDPMGRWQRIIIPLKDMQLSKSTRFRWQQRPLSNDEGITEFGILDLYIGPACDDLCGGHGNCHPDLYPACHCDNAGYFGHNCYPFKANNPIELKDTFTDKSVDKTLWSLVQGGTIQDPCSRLVEGMALVQDGPGIRQVVTVDMDLRDAKFVQYTASIGGKAGKGAGCFKPYSHEQSVVLQYSTDGGIHWHTLHTLDYTSYLAPRRDYIPLPQEARTPSTKVRWWQLLPEQDPDSLQPTWALDNVYIGGKEINPAKFQINFNESLMLNDQPWEFNPYGKIETDICKREDDVIMWEQGTGNRHFTTKQMIVQPDYILQFKIAVGCSQTFNICITHIPVSLMFNKNPAIESWHEVMPLCLPDINQRMDCRPNMYHTASQFTPDTHPTWTRVTMALPEKTFSSTTRFRWVQDSPDDEAPGWALDDIYVGEACPDMCHGRGDCKGGHCECDTGYVGKSYLVFDNEGKSCMPLKPQLPRMFDSFEGGVYTSHWDRVAGGGVGFGCGALLPYAHGKTLYFNGCGLREAKTVEMDLTTASKIMFVLQIGCKAQTAECNVKTSDQSHYRGVLLQYTTNQGSDWVLIARHDPGDHLTPKRLLYDIPPAARGQGVQFRWWQPIHGGEGHDQWAMDHVEIVPGRSMRYNRRRRRYRAHH